MTASSAPSAMVSLPKSSASTRSAAKRMRAQLMLHAHRGAALLQIGQRRLDQRRAQAVARDQRPAGAAAGGERLADDRAASRAEPCGGSMLSAASSSGSTSRSIERPLAGDDLADRLAGRRPQQPRQRQIVERPRSRHAPARIENPERQPAVVEAQRPALAAGEIDEGKFGRSPDRPADARRRCCADNRARRDCRTATDDCRCRSSCRAMHRDRSGSGRRRRRWPRARRRLWPRAASLHRGGQGRQGRRR